MADEFQKSTIALAKQWLDTYGPDKVFVSKSDGEEHTAEELYRIVRNRAWAKYGIDGLAAIDREIELGL